MSWGKLFSTKRWEQCELPRSIHFWNNRSCTINYTIRANFIVTVKFCHAVFETNKHWPFAYIFPMYGHTFTSKVWIENGMCVRLATSLYTLHWWSLWYNFFTSLRHFFSVHVAKFSHLFFSAFVRNISSPLYQTM